MKWIRTLVSALIILVASSLFSLWAVSAVTVRALEDGTAIHGIAADALADPDVVAALGDAIADDTLASLESRGVNTDLLGLEVALRSLISTAASSDVFRDALLDQVDASHEQFAQQLSESLTTPAPLVIAIDVSGYLNGLIDTIPVIGLQVPSIQLDPVEVQAIDAQTFEEVRGAYQLLKIAQAWAFWVGLGAVVVGMFVTGRLRWFLAKVGALTAAIAGGLYLALHFWGVEAIIAWLPGGADSSVSRLVTSVLTEAAVPAVELRLLELAAWSLIIGLVFFLIGVLTMPRQRPAYR